MTGTVKAGVLYFLLVFGAGFALGAGRSIWLVPRFGTHTAELTEMPVMVALSFLIARAIVRRRAIPADAARRLGMGGLALGLLILAESALTVALRGVSFAQYLADKDPVSGRAYAVSLVLFALMPMRIVRPAKKVPDAP